MRLTQALSLLREQLAKRATEPNEERVSKLIADGDTKTALHIKNEQVQASRIAFGEKLASDLYELGSIHELRFEWSDALASYREAWQLDANKEYGFRYAYIAQLQDLFSEAVVVYKDILQMALEPYDNATILNNLEDCYRRRRQSEDAEATFKQAISICQQHIESTPGYILPLSTAMTNLANIYYEMKERKMQSLCMRRLWMQCVGFQELFQRRNTVTLKLLH